MYQIIIVNTSSNMNSCHFHTMPFMCQNFLIIERFLLSLLPPVSCKSCFTTPVCFFCRLRYLFSTLALSCCFLDLLMNQDNLLLFFLVFSKSPVDKYSLERAAKIVGQNLLFSYQQFFLTFFLFVFISVRFE